MLSRQKNRQTRTYIIELATAGRNWDVALSDHSGVVEPAAVGSTSCCKWGCMDFGRHVCICPRLPPYEIMSYCPYLCLRSRHLNSARSGDSFTKQLGLGTQSYNLPSSEFLQLAPLPFGFYQLTGTVYFWARFLTSQWLCITGVACVTF